MRSFTIHRYAIRRNMIMMIGVSLCVYFAYHAIHGKRSLMRLSSLNSQIETMSQKNDFLRGERLALEKKVKMMRPESLDVDLLEERIRLTLGYTHVDEIVSVRNESL